MVWGDAWALGRCSTLWDFDGLRGECVAARSRRQGVLEGPWRRCVLKPPWKLVASWVATCCRVEGKWGGCLRPAPLWVSRGVVKKEVKWALWCLRFEVEVNEVGDAPGVSAGSTRRRRRRRRTVTAMTMCVLLLYTDDRLGMCGGSDAANVRVYPALIDM